MMNYQQNYWKQRKPSQFYLKSSGKKRKYQVTGKNESSQNCQKWETYQTVTIGKREPVINNTQSIYQDHFYTY